MHVNPTLLEPVPLTHLARLALKKSQVSFSTYKANHTVTLYHGSTGNALPYFNYF